MRDEAAELAQALGESQNAQIQAESSLVSAQQKVNKLERRVTLLEAQVKRLELENEGLRNIKVEYMPDPRAVDRG